MTRRSASCPTLGYDHRVNIFRVVVVLTACGAPRSAPKTSDVTTPPPDAAGLTMAGANTDIEVVPAPPEDSTVARGEGQPQILALVAKRTNKQLTFPCGACLQVALELGGLDLIVVASDPNGECAQARLAELAGRLPHKPR